jgi:hypothetical protein
VIVAEVERLHWRLWNGKAANARISIERSHAVMHHFKCVKIHRSIAKAVVRLARIGRLFDRTE